MGSGMLSFLPGSVRHRERRTDPARQRGILLRPFHSVLSSPKILARSLPAPLESSIEFIQFRLLLCRQGGLDVGEALSEDLLDFRLMLEPQLQNVYVRL